MTDSNYASMERSWPIISTQDDRHISRLFKVGDGPTSCGSVPVPNPPVQSQGYSLSQLYPDDSYTFRSQYDIDMNRFWAEKHGFNQYHLKF